MIAAAHVALLRGVNLGGKNRLPMKDLALMFMDAGCHNVSTYIQSGNVIFSALPTVAPQVTALIAAEIHKYFEFKTQIVLRTTDELRDVVSNNPFIKAGIAEETLHVLFLAELPNSSDIDDLNPDRSPPDKFIVRGREIYMNLPHGAARTKLTNSYFDSKLKTISTSRNWRTVKKLFELTQGGAVTS
ncbi:MAG: DUF1697 domain-containing protein [Bryobacteraceae bacterium]